MKFSGRKFMVVASILTLCLLMLALVIACTLDAELYAKLEKWILILTGGFIGLVNLIGSKYFDRSDRPAVEPSKPEGGTIVKLLIAVLLAGSLSVGVASADLLNLNLGVAQVAVAGDVNAGGLVNVAPKLLNGAASPLDTNSTLETTVGYVPLSADVKLDIDLGTASGALHTGAPYGALSYKWNVATAPWLQWLGLDDVKAGLGFGYDFELVNPRWEDHVIFGLTVSTNLLTLFK